jgi:hypothetical protein
MKYTRFGKLFALTTVSLGMILFLASCQKDLELNPDGVSVGKLKTGAAGNCLPVVVNGIFIADSILSNDNYVDVQVDVALAGSFNIKSDSVNGFSFKKVGTVGSGANIIRLYASGKPVAPGVNTFTITYGQTSCSFTITVYGGGSGLGTALYTLGGAPGNCAISSITGNYIVGLVMVAANRVEMTVNVTGVGTYIINGTVINGVSFSASGVFTNPGIQTIFLAATGTPTGPGPFIYPVTNGATNCSFSIIYNTVITNASFNLSGSPGGCTGALVNGTYTVGTALGPLNAALIYVNVLSPGNYNIATTTVNGISFSASGTFNITGQQQVILAGTGTPIVAGPFNYPVTGGGNTCIISVASTVVNIDYVPQTDYSNWSWRTIGGGPDDTSYVHVLLNPIAIGGNTYKIFETVNSINFPGIRLDSFYYRKNGGLYYYRFDDNYSFDNGFNVDGLLLDSSLAVNANWIINLGNDTWGGLPAVGSIKATILAKGATATVAGSNYSNIIKVEYVFRYDTGAGNVDYERWESWYARGIGNIYNKYNDIPSTGITEEEVYRKQIY